MPKFSPPNLQVFARAVFLLGVLAGLVFSCGEGIRLLPFPPEAADGENSRWKSGAEIVYQENASRVESKQGNQQTKFQRGSQTNHQSAAGDIFHRCLSFRGAGKLPETARPFNSRILNSRLFSASYGSRAPPVS